VEFGDGICDGTSDKKLKYKNIAKNIVETIGTVFYLTFQNINNIIL
jgi:hypothetical protein